LTLRTVSIRDVRGASLAESARRGELVGVTNHRVLIAVVVPMTLTWIEHVIEHNWSRVQQSITEGETDIAAAAPMVTLDRLLANTGRAGEGGEQRSDQTPSAGYLSRPADLAARRQPSVGNVTQAAAAAAVSAISGAATATADALKWLWPAAGRPAPADTGEEGKPARPSVRTVRVGDLSATLIEEAGAQRESLALTHDRELIGIMVPVTPRLVEYLVEQNITRVLYNIELGEKEVAAEIPFTTPTDVAAKRTVHVGSPAVSAERKPHPGEPGSEGP
jgi:hypothetical protein